MLRKNMPLRKSLVNGSCAASIASLHGKEGFALPEKHKADKTALALSGVHTTLHRHQRYGAV